MPRNARSTQNENIFHVLVEGINSEKIFKTKEFKEIYLGKIMDSLANYEVRLLAYCIMDTHAHLVVYAASIPQLSFFMSTVNKVYSRKFNSLNNRDGALFDGRFKSQPLKAGEELAAAIRFVHLNPVLADVVKTQSAYDYSSVHAYMQQSDSIIDYDSLTALLQGYSVDSAVDCKLTFLESNDNELEQFENVFKELMRKYHITSAEMFLSDEELVARIVVELKARCGLSIRALAGLLNVGRETLRKVIIAYTK